LSLNDPQRHMTDCPIFACSITRVESIDYLGLA
jgi:hypothetical protein